LEIPSNAADSHNSGNERRLRADPEALDRDVHFRCICDPEMQRMADTEFVRACDSLMEAGFPIPSLPDPMEEETQRILMASIREGREPIREEVFRQPPPPPPPPPPSHNLFPGLLNLAFDFFHSNLQSSWARSAPLPAPARPLSGSSAMFSIHVLPPPPPAPESHPPAFPEGDADRLMRHEQDRGFEAALHTQQQREIEQEAREWEEKERAQGRVAMRESINLMFEELGPEPPGGVTIAVVLPSRTRITRRFLATDRGEMIFRWVRHEDELFDADGAPKHFDLANGIGIVRPDGTLIDQGMGRPARLTVMESD
jgi:hypothetical protein